MTLALSWNLKIIHALFFQGNISASSALRAPPSIQGFWTKTHFPGRMVGTGDTGRREQATDTDISGNIQTPWSKSRNDAHLLVSTLMNIFQLLYILHSLLLHTFMVIMQIQDSSINVTRITSSDQIINKEQDRNRLGICAASHLIPRSERFIWTFEN